MSGGPPEGQSWWSEEAGDAAGLPADQTAHRPAAPHHRRGAGPADPLGRRRVLRHLADVGLVLLAVVVAVLVVLALRR